MPDTSAKRNFQMVFDIEQLAAFKSLMLIQTRLIAPVLKELKAMSFRVRAYLGRHDKARR